MPMIDLAALVLTVAPRKPVTTPGHLGRAAHSLLLRLIGATEPDLAEALHNSHTTKPFTCTTLIGGQRLEDLNTRRYLPDEPAWLRFTGLNTAVTGHLLRLAADPPPTIELDGHTFVVQSATIDPDIHPWAGHTSYEDLGTPHLLAHRPPDFHIKLEFASPTTFRSQGRSLPTPMPEWVFGSLLDRWKRRHAQNGGSQQGVFSFQILIRGSYSCREI
jgi:CRISPR-associated endoribonuclease Cas6